MLADLICDPGSTLQGWLAALQGLWHAWWPLPAVTALAAVAVAVVRAYARREACRRAAASARWVEIQPPARPSPDAGVNFWHTIAGILNRTRRHTIGPRTLAMELIATDQTTRIGVWVPTALSTRAVADAVTGAWPDARVATTDRPTLVGTRRVRAADVTPRGGEWAPLIDTTRRHRDSHTEEPIGQTLSSLADRRRGEIACAQLLVTAHRSDHDGSSAWLRPLSVALTMLRALRQIIFWLFDLFLTSTRATNGHHGTRHSSGEQDPVTKTKQQAINAKKADSPHLRVTLRVAVASWGKSRQRRNVVAAIAGGYDRVARATELLLTHTRRAAWRVVTRRPGRGFIATTDELAALWHLPGHASRYGITENPSRSWDPRHDLPRIPRHSHDPRGDDHVA
ncbi:MAG: hypothetical protein GEV07_05375 [Streptosporangiales bacterium]|nr:hypothetical protein [Streptosporangiales bacterium]